MLAIRSEIDAWKDKKAMENRYMDVSICRKGKYAAVSVNWPQTVLLVEFKADAPDEQLIMQEANEGEWSDHK